MTNEEKRKVLLQALDEDKKVHMTHNSPYAGPSPLEGYPFILHCFSGRDFEIILRYRGGLYELMAAEIDKVTLSD